MKPKFQRQFKKIKNTITASCGFFNALENKVFGAQETPFPRVCWKTYTLHCKQWGGIPNKQIKKLITSKALDQILRATKLTFINLLILISIWTMISINLRVDLPQVLPAIYPPQDPEHIISRINWHIRYYDWLIDHIGFGAGLKNYWRMFSPVDRFNWNMKFIAVHKNGEEELLPITTQIDRNFVERNLIDFREAKFHLNIYNNKLGQKYYSQYLCRKYSNDKNPIISIQIYLGSKKIISPEKAKELGTAINPVIQTRVWGNFTCNS